MVPVALLAGLTSVGEAMKDAEVSGFLLDALHEEIIPALALPRAELEPFAADVLRRFANPYIHHRLESIALNSWAKFAARVMPQLLAYQRERGTLPRRLVLALAATMHLYRGSLIKLGDDAAHLDWFATAWQSHAAGQLGWNDFAARWLARQSLWGRDLNEVPGLAPALAEALAAIEAQGMRPLLRALKTAA
jgi:tagaturonate reductase